MKSNKQLETSLLLIFFVIVSAPFVVFSLKQKTKDQVEFWHYWSSGEKEALEKLVDKFNSQDHSFKVKLLQISLPRKKVLTAITGKVAPDLVHLDNEMVASFALRNALQNLDPLLDKTDLSKYNPVFLQMLNIQNHQWALPLLPSSEAMHVNRGLMNKLGEKKTPKTLQDIERAFDKSLELKNQIAFLPTWPPWMGIFVPAIFGGGWGVKNPDGSWSITANSKANVQAWEWVQNKFAKKISQQRLISFSEGFQAYQSPENPFFSGKIAIEASGIWEKHLLTKFAPELDIAIAPFPGSVDKPSYLRLDALAIPKGAKHSKQSSEFVKWLSSRSNLEYLALAQKKFTPLKTHSKDFFAKHPNPYISTFIDLAASPNAIYFPQVRFISRYQREIKSYYDKVIRLELKPQEALDELQTKMVKIKTVFNLN